MLSEILQDIEITQVQTTSQDIEGTEHFVGDLETGTLQAKPLTGRAVTMSLRL